MGKVLSALRGCLHSEHPELAIRYIAGEEIDIQNLEPSSMAPAYDEDVLTEKVDQQRFCHALLQAVDDQRKEDIFTDVELTIGNKSFSAHRNILAVVSPYFGSLLTEDDCKQIELDKKYAPVADDLVSFLCTGKCTVTEENIDLLFEAGGKLEIECIVSALKPFAYQRNSIRGNLKPFKRTDIASLVASVEELKNKGMFCDVTVLTSDERAIPGHKNIMAAASPYFKGLFTSNMKEKNEKSVDFSFVKPEIVDDILRYMYTGKICITEENYFPLLEYGDFLLISQLKDKIGRYLEGTLALSNCLSVCTIAKHYNCEELHQTANDFVCQNFPHVSKSQEFLELGEEHIRSLLSSDDIIASEAHVLEALIAWYRHDSENRKGMLESLFSLIRLDAIPTGYMEKVADRYRLDIFQRFLRKKSDECYPFPRSKANNKSKITKPLWMLWNGDNLEIVAKHYNLALFGITSDRLACYWLPFGGPWSYVMSIPGTHQPFTNWPLLFTNNTIYVPTSCNHMLGYWNDPMERRCYETFRNEKSAKGSSTIPLPGLQQCAAAVVGDFVYVTGGTDWTERVEGAVQRYNLKKDSWEVVASLQEPRFFHTAVGLRRRYLYVLGGVNTIPAGYWIEMSSVEKYDSHTNTWTQVSPLKKARHGASAFVLHDKIFVAGGEGSFKNKPCEIYDPIADEWHLATYQSLPETANNINDTIFFFDPLMLSSRGVLRMKFSTLNIETGEEQEVMSVTSWPHNILKSCIVPLSRGMMSKVLK